LVTKRSPPSIRAAAVFYIQQVLWADDADCYRILGASADASPARLAEHFRWLMKWLHPDRRQSDVKPALAARVLKAWDAVKTPERRRQYDQTLNRPPARGRPRRGRAAALSARRIPWIAPTSPGRSPTGRWGVAVVAAVVVVAALVFSDRIASWRGFALRTDEAATAGLSPDVAPPLQANDLPHSN
jgi:curved DNA-binding protein CbpA